MKMIKALVCALSLLSMTASVSAGTVMAVLAGVAVAKPLQNEASKVSQGLGDVFFGAIYCATAWFEKGSKSLPEDGTFRLDDIKPADIIKQIPNTLKQTTKSAAMLGLSTGAIWAASKL